MAWPGQPDGPAEPIGGAGQAQQEALKGLDKKERRTLTKLLARIEENLTRAAPDNDEDADEAALVTPAAQDGLGQADAPLDPSPPAPSEEVVASAPPAGNEHRAEEARAGD